MKDLRVHVGDGALHRVEHAFAEWRGQPHRGRIPERLWAMAVALVEHGGRSVSYVSRRLRLSPGDLKRRVVVAGSWKAALVPERAAVLRGPRFRELTLPDGGQHVRTGHETVRIRVEGRQGIAMEIFSPASVFGDVAGVVGRLLR